MNPLVPQLRARIETEGPIPFAEYMRVALYDPVHGYYASGAERTGRGGDFMTSPELDPAFGELWARALEQIWSECGRPERFDLVEVGPGEAGLVGAILSGADESLRRALRVTLVEPSAARRDRQQRALASADVGWVSDITEVAPVETGCVIANEVLDNQPVHVFRRQEGRIEELYVASDGGALVEAWLPCSDQGMAGRIAEHLEDGMRLEVSPEGERVVAACVALIERGAAVFIDYGRRSGASDTVLSYSESGVGTPELNEPGSWDITAHVDWSAVAGICGEVGARAVGPLKQRDVLRALGAGAYDDDLREAYTQALEQGDGATALRSLSRRQALGALLDSGGLGGLDVFVALKNVAVPGFAKEKDRPAGRSS